MPQSDQSPRPKVLQAVANAVSDRTGRCVVGFSGGLDSTVLLWAAHQQVGSRVVAAHVNHGWHPDAAHWEARCEATARGLGVEFRSTRLSLDRIGNLEDEARRARHAWLAGLLQTGDLLLLAHHQDDQAETLLLRVIQGRGAYGMPVHRAAGRGELVRPFLAIPRADLHSVAVASGLQWIEDPANGEPRYDRVWLRREVLPRLTSRGPDVLTRVAGLAHRELHRESAATHLAATLPRPVHLQALPAAAEVAAEVLRWWLLAQGGPETSSRDLHNWISSVRSNSATCGLSLRRGRLIHYQSRLYWQDVLTGVEATPILTIDGEVELPHGRFHWRDANVGAGLRVDFDQPKLRLRRGRGFTTARALLQRAVLPWERYRYPLVVRDGALVSIPDVAQSESKEGVFRFVPAVPTLRPDFDSAGS